ncbi:MAG: SDR family oxidoreductase [Pelagimonas sp.]|uniref:SDR family oxidoreductase n=1 Tax=Pelagimonas sp. TaxID=2073170 RepID=UPI003D6AE318
MTKTLFSLGHGYTASALASRLIPQGWHVLGTIRDAAKADSLRAQGVEPVLWSSDAMSAALETASHLLISVGANDTGDPTLNIIGNQIQARATAFDWVGYLSTTGVYGDHDGAWVDETAPLTPATHRGEIRVAAENAWKAIPDLPLHIFRLAGIYGPGRGPFAKVRAGTARRVIKKGQVFSRIHVDDIAQVLEASINAPNPGGVYNVCDNDPAPPQDVIAYAANLLGMTLPPEVDFESANLSPMARSFYAENKKVANARIKTELGVKLLYPDYKSGLRALLQDELP